VKLSVIVVTYNHERFIAQALDSILAQRVDFDYEIVVGEDCSTDSTRDILMDFHRRYPGRIVPLVREQNLGATRNFEDVLASSRPHIWHCWKRTNTREFVEQRGILPQVIHRSEREHADLSEGGHSFIQC
jgi:cellulose synthase/poly-beta-1,6-N-acetylglucosamine synthase-like glycosyltransferase